MSTTYEFDGERKNDWHKFMTVWSDNGYYGQPDKTPQITYPCSLRHDRGATNQQLWTAPLLITNMPSELTWSVCWVIWCNFISVNIAMPLYVFLYLGITQLHINVFCIKVRKTLISHFIDCIGLNRHSHTVIGFVVTVHRRQYRWFLALEHFVKNAEQCNMQ